MKAEKPKIFLGYSAGLVPEKIKSLYVYSNPQLGLIISIDFGFLCIFCSDVWSQ